MDEKEKKSEKETEKVKKTMVSDKTEELSLGDYLLEKEFRMHKAAEELLAKHNSEKDKSKEVE